MLPGNRFRYSLIRYQLSTRMLKHSDEALWMLFQVSAAYSNAQTSLQESRSSNVTIFL